MPLTPVKLAITFDQDMVLRYLIDALYFTAALALHSDLRQRGLLTLFESWHLAIRTLSKCKSSVPILDV